MRFFRVDAGGLESRRKCMSGSVRIRQKKSKRAQVIRRRRILLFAALIVIAAVIIAVICLASGVFEKRAEKSTLTLNADGSLICEEVAAFDGDQYDKAELKKYAKTQIDAYNEENGKDSVRLERVAVKDGVSYMRVRYADAGDYQKFTGYEIFSGTIEKAQEAGYTFQDSFAQVKDGKKGDSVAAQDVTADNGQKTLILRENITVKVDGTILYVSEESTEAESSDTLSIAQVDGNMDATSLTYIIYK